MHRLFIIGEVAVGLFHARSIAFLGRQRAAFGLGTQRGLGLLEKRGMRFWLMTRHSSISSAFGFDLQVGHSSQGMHVQCTYECTNWLL